MKYQIPFRVVVSKPLSGVVMRVQRGKDELLDPTSTTADAIAFEFEMTVDVSGEHPNFLGKYSQGPKDARFVYVNSGTYAGQHPTCWSRRAKLSLMTISRDEAMAVVDNPDSCLEAVMPGVGRDGGPTCASVKGIEWRIVKK
ncbi:MAG TPA: DUF5990 family protein [Pyrinomonadaceae bacterium]|nr:DUF5990 family protein [Pyrinomonadaceae bacterium]